jgi:ParB family transcriptional regulator, chromosome partitioning protein
MRFPSSSATKRSAPQNAESLRTQGLIQPITVRPASEGFEIVAGARRFRAAHLAEMDEIPVRIVHLSDEQALEWQLVEFSEG